MNKNHTLYPVFKEISSDIETPVSAFLALKEDSTKAFLLESVETNERIGRYSFIGFEPELEFSARRNQVHYRFQDQSLDYECSNPIDELKRIAGLFKENKNEALPPFSTGLVGYFSYDSVRYFETIPDEKPDKMELPDIYLILPKILIAFDNVQQKMVLMSFAYDKDNTAQAEELIKKYEEKLFSAKPPSRISEPRDNKISLTSNTKKENFIDAVEKAKKYIVAGDIFQVVLSQKFRVNTELAPLDIYRKLRMINPSPYMFYLDFADFQIIGSSPEVMAKRTKDDQKDEIILRPIAGTRPRGKTKNEDALLEKELLSDKKELAEHTMLLDLARNDAGRVSEYGSVTVERPFHIERYSHVMHIVSDVIGRAKQGLDALDVIGAAFPAGTVTGSPKVRAMEIIEELEPEKRGIYAGTIGYIDFRGNTDTCITIRTMVYKDKTVNIQAGAGIVYDSVPEKEYQETINKAKALMKALV
jgi:anthranilate synthase component I